MSSFRAISRSLRIAAKRVAAGGCLMLAVLSLVQSLRWEGHVAGHPYRGIAVGTSDIARVAALLDGEVPSDIDELRRAAESFRPTRYLVWKDPIAEFCGLSDVHEALAQLKDVEVGDPFDFVRYICRGLHPWGLNLRARLVLVRALRVLQSTGASREHKRSWLAVLCATRQCWRDCVEDLDRARLRSIWQKWIADARDPVDDCLWHLAVFGAHGLRASDAARVLERLRKIETWPVFPDYPWAEDDGAAERALAEALLRDASASVAAELGRFGVWMQSVDEGGGGKSRTARGKSRTARRRVVLRVAAHWLDSILRSPHAKAGLRAALDAHSANLVALFSSDVRYLDEATRSRLLDDRSETQNARGWRALRTPNARSFLRWCRGVSAAPRESVLSYLQQEW